MGGLVVGVCSWRVVWCVAVRGMCLWREVLAVVCWERSRTLVLSRAPAKHNPHKPHKHENLSPRPSDNRPLIQAVPLQAEEEEAPPTPTSPQPKHFF